MKNTLTQEFTLKQLSEITESQLIGNGEIKVSGVAGLEHADKHDVSFLANPKYADLAKTTKASLICVGRDYDDYEEDKNYLVCENPSLAFQTIALAIIQPEKFMTAFDGIHETAVIHESVKLGKNVTIGPYVVIDQNVAVGDNTRIDPFVYIGAGSQIGNDCHFNPHVTLREATLVGDRVILQPGSVIGSCGFGYTTDESGKHTKLDQLGTTVIESDVEIGACTTVDRARFHETKVSEGTKIDNLVQIGHNVNIGKHNLIVSQVGIAGTVKTGRNVVMAGQVGVAGHLHIGDFAMIAPKAGVNKSLKPNGKYSGAPAIDGKEHFKQLAHMKKLGQYAERIKNLEKRLEELEKKS